MCFSSIFYIFFNEKSMPDHAQNVQTVTSTKIVKKSRLERLFGTQNWFFVDFWIPSGSPGASQDMTEAAQSSFFLSWIWGSVWKPTLSAAREAQWRCQGDAGRHPGIPRAPSNLSWIRWIFRCTFSVHCFLSVNVFVVDKSAAPAARPFQCVLAQTECCETRDDLPP